jgi:hypothetical protein
MDVTLHYHAESGRYQHSPPTLPTRNLGSTRSELLGQKRQLETDEHVIRIVGHSLLCPGFLSDSVDLFLQPVWGPYP